MSEVVGHFDRAKPSPISMVIAMLSSASESVVVAGKLTDHQASVAIDDGLADRIVRRVESGDLDLVVISGSAGDGKSFTLGSILARAGNPWEGYADRVIEDATHSERPEQAQHDRLKKFFEPITVGRPPLSGPPLVIAMNTGMVIRFFDELRVTGEFEPYRELAAGLFAALRIPDRVAREADPEVTSRILVVNLDDRPTTGGPDSFFSRLLEMFDPSLDSGVMKGAERCGSCTVRPWCWVRSNAEILSASDVRATFDGLANEVALVRGRSLSPRSLWDAAAVIALGAARFGEGDPCDTIAEAAARQDWQRLWDHALPNGIFHLDEVPGLASELGHRDPTFRADKHVHEEVAKAGIDAAQDARTLLAALGGRMNTERSAINTLASGLQNGELGKAIGPHSVSREVPRALVRAQWISGAAPVADPVMSMFEEALEQYAANDGGPAVDAIEDRVGDALARSFGESIGGEHFFRTGRQDGRDVAVYAAVELVAGRSYGVRLKDPVKEHNSEGAEIAGYRPLVLPLEIEDIDVTLTYGLFRLLDEACDGRLPSAAELEQFYSLGRAVTALGSQAAQDQSKPIVIADRREGLRLIRIQLVDRRGSRRYRQQEVL